MDGPSVPQPQVSKHVRVRSDVGPVRCKADGRRPLYRLEPAHLRPLHAWVARYEQRWAGRVDQMDDYMQELQRQEGSHDG